MLMVREAQVHSSHRPQQAPAAVLNWQAVPAFAPALSLKRVVRPSAAPRPSAARYVCPHRPLAAASSLRRLCHRACRPQRLEHRSAAGSHRPRSLRGQCAPLLPPLSHQRAHPPSLSLCGRCPCARALALRPRYCHWSCLSLDPAAWSVGTTALLDSVAAAAKAAG